MHGNDVGVVRDGSQSRSHGLRPGCSARHDPFGGPVTGGGAGRQHEHHAGADLTGGLEGPGHEGAATQVRELLGGSEAGARACRHHDRPGRHRDVRLSGEGVVQLLFGLGLAHPDGEGELGHQDLAGPVEHAFLAGREALVLVPVGQVPDHLGHLINVP